ncbi:hypothetical protein FRC06_004184, partial [Ceratobasidium sp. 370]
PIAAPDPALGYRKGPRLHCWQGTCQVRKPLPSSEGLAATSTNANTKEGDLIYAYSARPCLILKEEHHPLCEIQAPACPTPPGKLPKHASSEGTKSVTRFSAGTGEADSDLVLVVFPLSSVMNL